MKNSGNIVASQDEALRTYYLMLAGELPGENLLTKPYRKALWKMFKELGTHRHQARLESYDFSDIQFKIRESGCGEIRSAHFRFKCRGFYDLLHVELQLRSLKIEDKWRWHTEQVIIHPTEMQETDFFFQFQKEYRI